MSPAERSATHRVASTTPEVRELAPAKLNLLLRVGQPRADGMHPLVSVFARLALCDELEIAAPDGLERDHVECPGVDGENLITRALSALRQVLPHLPPLQVRVRKRIPVAAGLGGGSADAAAALRGALRLLEARGDRWPETRGRSLDLDELRDLALRLGSDVPSQLRPGNRVVWGIGERFREVSLPRLPVVLVPHREGLATAAVYRKLDELRSTHSPPKLAGTARAAKAQGTPASLPDPDALAALLDTADVGTLAALFQNDLEVATLALRPELAEPLARLRSLGALVAGVAGSGPTVFGLFASPAAARAAAREFARSLGGGFEAPIVTAIQRSASKGRGCACA